MSLSIDVFKNWKSLWQKGKGGVFSVLGTMPFFYYYLDEIETHCYHRNTEEEVDRAEGNPCDIFDYWKCCFLRTRNSVCWSIDNVQCQYACTKKGLEGLEVYIVFIACFKGLKEYIIHFPNGIPSQSTDRNFSNQMSEHLVFFNSS